MADVFRVLSIDGGGAAPGEVGCGAIGESTRLRTSANRPSQKLVCRMLHSPGPGGVGCSGGDRARATSAGP